MIDISDRWRSVMLARGARMLLLCGLLASGIGCRLEARSPQPESVGAGAGSAPRQIVRTELIFGSHRRNAADVSDWQWRTFVNDEVTPRFPDGLTILSGDGQWCDKSNLVEHERAWLIIILHERSPEADRKIEEIRQIYKHRFEQESVIRADSTENVWF